MMKKIFIICFVFILILCGCSKNYELQIEDIEGSLYLINDNHQVLTKVKPNGSQPETLYIAEENTIINALSSNCENLLLVDTTAIPFEISYLSLMTNEKKFICKGDYPIWFPNSQEVLYRLDRDSLCEYFCVNIENSNSKSIFRLEKPALPKISPKGKKIMIASAKDMKHIYIFSTTGEIISEIPVEFDLKIPQYDWWNEDTIIIRANGGALLFDPYSGATLGHIGFGHWFQQRVFSNSGFLLIYSESGHSANKLEAFLRALIGIILQVDYWTLLGADNSVINEFRVSSNFWPEYYSSHISMFICVDNSSLLEFSESIKYADIKGKQSAIININRNKIAYFGIENKTGRAARR